MSRSDRLMRLVQLLRKLQPPVTAAQLAMETGVSERTLYRDIESLRAAGALIDGEAGYGYRLVEDPALPPQMFSRLEVEALVLGLAEVRAKADPELAEAAEAVLSKIIATLPERVQRQAMHSVVSVYRFRVPDQPSVDMALLRDACWLEQAVNIHYRDAAGLETERRIYPLSIVYLDEMLMLLAWCCLRGDYRRFMISRMVGVARTGESFRPNRVTMLREFTARLRAGTAL